MIVLIHRADLIIFLSIFLTLSIHANQEYDLIISNVNLIDGSGSPLQKNVNIFIKNNKIEKIDSSDIGSAEVVIDGTGKFLIPGLFDCHTHPGQIEKTFPKFIHYGVTSILVTGCSTCSDENYSQMRSLGEQNSIPAPRVFHTSQHFTMEGRHPVKTYKSNNWVEGKTVFFLRDTLQIESIVKQVADQPIVGIKLTIEEGPAPPFVERMPQEFVSKVVKEAAEYDLEVFAHVSDNMELSIAQKAGVQNLVHFTGVDIDWQRDTELVQKLAADNVSWITTLMIDKGFLYRLYPEWLEKPGIKESYDSAYVIGISDPNRKETVKNFMLAVYGVEEPTIENIIIPQADDIKKLYGLGINFALGTDTGNEFIFPGYSLHEEMQLMEMGGFDQMEIIKMATHNAAIMLNVIDTLGTIEEGKVADMLLLDQNPLDEIKNTLSINLVIKGGKIQQRIDLEKSKQ